MRGLYLTILSVVSSSCVPAYSIAADRHVVCLQKQLLEAGIDVGTVDGQLGRKTQAGLNKLKVKLPTLDKLPKLSEANASVFCRAIGLARGSKTGWSSNDGILQLVPGTKLKAQSLQRIESTAAEVSTFYREQLGVVLPHRIAFVVSGSVEEAAELAVASLRAQGSKHNVSKIFKDWCRGYAYCGMSFGGVVAIHFSDSGPLPEGYILKLLPHELAHEIQAQYVGNFRGRGEENRVRQRGPKWLTEAAAHALERKFRHPNLEAKYQLKRIKLNKKYTAARLKSFGYQDSDTVYNFEDYSTYAGVLLASKASHTAFLDFWEKTPELGWKKSFEAAFGMTINKFYADFGT